MFNPQDEQRRTEVLRQIEENNKKRAKEREQSFIKSQNNEDLIQKRMGSDLFKGGMN